MAKWVCPQCRARFPFQSGVDPECPDCGYTLTDRSNNGVAAPRIGYFKNKSADRIYRQEEAASRERAHMAAEITGESVSDMSAMLQTNQKDGLREGDTSAPSIRPDNQVVQNTRARATTIIPEQLDLILASEVDAPIGELRLPGFDRLDVLREFIIEDRIVTGL